MPITQNAIIYHKTSLQDAFASALNKRAIRFLKAAKSDATLIAYKSDTFIFTTWCLHQNIDPMDCTHYDIMNFLADQADGVLSDLVYDDNGLPSLIDGKPKKPATLVRRLAGVRYAYKKKNVHPSPVEHDDIKEMMRGITRVGDNEKCKSGAMTLEKLFSVLDEIDLKKNAGSRDRALMLLMFSCALRRSEAARLTVDDFSFTSQGMIVKIKPSKHKMNDSFVAVIYAKGAHCPVTALQHWLDKSNIKSGAVFRRIDRWDTILEKPIQEKGINNIIKKRCDLKNDVSMSSHSLRRGFITSAVTNGKPMNKIMEITRHKDIRTLKEYFDDKEKFESHAMDGLL